jgi:tol-pal system beta propeller repeat protein TolB
MNSQYLKCAVFGSLLLVLGACSPAEQETSVSGTDGIDLIAFQTSRDGNSEIYLMDAEGARLVNISLHDSLDYHPSGSMDGSLITFISGRGDSREIWVMDRDGSNPRQVTTSPNGSIDPSFSPDGSRIVYDAQNEEGNDEIYIISVVGGEAVNLSNHSAVDSHPFWSPSGDRIAFYSNRMDLESDSMDIFVMNIDGSDVTQLTDHEADDRYPSWSPDGSQLAFSSNRDGDAEIYVMNASDGSGVTRLTFSAEDDLAPAWSPDGTQIAFVSAREGPFEVMIINVDGTGETNLSNHETSDSNPRWVPARN